MWFHAQLAQNILYGIYYMISKIYNHEFLISWISKHISGLEIRENSGFVKMPVCSRHYFFRVKQNSSVLKPNTIKNLFMYDVRFILFFKK